MKSLNEYIVSELLTLDDNNGNIICEGFWDKLKQIFGYDKDKVAKTASNWTDDMRNAFATGQYIAAKSKDNTIKNIAKEQGKAAEKSSNELLAKTKIYVQQLLKRIDDIKYPEHIMSQYFLLSDLSKAENDNEGKELAAKCKKIIDEKWPDGGKKYEKDLEKVKNSPVAKQLVNKKDNKQEKDKSSSSIGIDGEEQKIVTTKQETQEIEQNIVSNKDFYKEIAGEAGIKGTELRDSVVKLINSSFKEEIKDKPGTYKWKVDTKGFQTKNEDKLIKGLSSIICGLLMINHKGMNEAVTSSLIDLGFSKKEILDKLLKK